ncbi:dihydroneopterin aldolase [Pseudonocardia spinosispora]|uniref:dihydroneopterin aldolase n=1 Tax=Pseudonocardia spinosispora TaxID=103441 RepID=UPI0003FA4157|nr:dihydroneopterin aldolase [Pseudonocardia spinosispora]
MTDRIVLTGLRVRGNHGVFGYEKRDGQEFVVDLTVWADLSAAGRSDELTDTLDYGALAQTAADVISGPSLNLIEAVAARIAERILESRGIEQVEVTVHKPSAPIPLDFADVAVCIRRTRS